MSKRYRTDYDMAALNQRIDRLRERYTVAVLALRRYGSHDQKCTVVLDDYGDHEPLGCSCGYDSVLHGLGDESLGTAEMVA